VPPASITQTSTQHQNPFPAAGVNPMQGGTIRPFRTTHNNGCAVSGPDKMAGQSTHGTDCRQTTMGQDAWPLLAAYGFSTTDHTDTRQDMTGQWLEMISKDVNRAINTILVIRCHTAHLIIPQLCLVTSRAKRRCYFRRDHRLLSIEHKR
jgi:hypothetical protein